MSRTGIRTSFTDLTPFMTLRVYLARNTLDDSITADLKILFRSGILCGCMTQLPHRSTTEVVKTLILYTPLRSVEINALTHLVLTPISKFLKSSSCSAIFFFLFHQHLVPGKHSNVYRMYEVNEISSEGKRMREMDVQTLATKMTIQSFAHIHVLKSAFSLRGINNE